MMTAEEPTTVDVGVQESVIFTALFATVRMYVPADEEFLEFPP